MESRIIRSWNLPVTANEYTITGMGLVWWDNSEDTQHQLSVNQWEALTPQATIVNHRSDVIACFNHDFAKVLGRESNNTLEMIKTTKGIEYTIQLNEHDPEHRSIKAKVDRGDIQGSSATFAVNRWHWTETNHGEVLLFDEIELIEIGPVTMPAMTGTNRVAASDNISDFSRRAAATRQRFLGA